MVQYAADKGHIDSETDVDDYDCDEDPEGVKAFAKKNHGQDFYQWVIDNDKLDILKDAEYTIISNNVYRVLDEESGVKVTIDPSNPGAEWGIEDNQVPVFTQKRTEWGTKKDEVLAAFKGKQPVLPSKLTYVKPKSKLDKSLRSLTAIKNKYGTDESNPKNIRRAIPISIKDLTIPKKRGASSSSGMVREEEI
jgi:hypothetical protein